MEHNSTEEEINNSLNDDNLEDSEIEDYNTENQDKQNSPNDTETENNFLNSCLYNFIDNEDINEEIDSEKANNLDNNINSEIKIIVEDSKRITKPILYKYERVRIIGERTKQLSLGAKPMIKNTKNLDPKKIALLELEKGCNPFIIERPMPDGRFERWKVRELKIIN